MRTQKVRFLVVAASFLLLPVALLAQQENGNIAGVVRDTSGAVMPGVTVEATSPALIEKVRAVVTDERGLYRVIELRPGVYTVTFTLPGFSTFRRENIEISSGFTATVNVDMRVGALEETITVSGQAPLVDIQNVQQQTTVSRETLDALPTTRRTAQIATLIVGANTGNTAFHDVGGVGSDRGEFGVHGQRTADMTYNWSGMDSRQASGGSFPHNVHLVSELVVETAAGSAESSTGGVQVNIIPKDGGNRFSGSLGTELTGPSLQSENLTEELEARGLMSAPSLKTYRDIGGGLGGPLSQDKLWFFGAVRDLDRSQYVAGNYYNAAHGQPFVSPAGAFTATRYVPDTARPGWSHDYSTDFSLRLTWQAAQQHKISLQHTQHPSCQCTFGLFENRDPFLSPEVVGEHHYDPQFLSVLSYTYPVTNQFLIEFAGARQAYHRHQQRQHQATDAITGDVISVNDTGLNLTYGSRNSYQTQPDDRWHEKISLSYVTGSHNFKAGVDLNQFTLGRLDEPDAYHINQLRSYTLRDERPVSVILYANPVGSYNTATENAVYAQDQWRIQNLTLNLGLRYAVYNADIPEFHLPAGVWVGAMDFPEVKGSPHWQNLSPRLGAAYDLFGNGRTALKVSWGRYSSRNTGSALDIPSNARASSTTASWNDSFFPVGDPRRDNFTPDCDLTNRTTDAECTRWSEPLFGQVRSTSSREPDAIGGFNNQTFNWQGSVSVQHELRPGLAVNVGWFRTWYDNFLVTDNQSLAPADYDHFCIMAPVDGRLGDVSGQEVCGLYDLKSTSFGRPTNNLIRHDDPFGHQTEVFNGFDVTVNARFGTGGQVQGGLATGVTTTDNCFVVDSPQQAREGFCNVSQPWSAASQVKFSVIYPLVWDITTSAIYQNSAGFPIAASYQASNAEVLQSASNPNGLPRNLASCPAPTGPCTQNTGAFDLVPLNTVFEDRISQLDLRFGRTFRFGATTRVRANFDIYNIFNTATILAENTRYGTSWLNVNQVMGGRLFKFSFSLDF